MAATRLYSLRLTSRARALSIRAAGGAIRAGGPPYRHEVWVAARLSGYPPSLPPAGQAQICEAHCTSVSTAKNWKRNIAVT